jgi:hypothetical protein
MTRQLSLERTTGSAAYSARSCRGVGEPDRGHLPEEPEAEIAQTLAWLTGQARAERIGDPTPA